MKYLYLFVNLLDKNHANMREKFEKVQQHVGVLIKDKHN